MLDASFALGIKTTFASLIKCSRCVLSEWKALKAADGPTFFVK
jgi:hypothetical protein